MVNHKAEEKSSKNSKQMADQIKIIVNQLEAQENFIQELSKSIQENKLEKVMTLLAANREFVTSDFIASRTGHMLANYLEESATDLLLNKYPFLHLSKIENNGKKVFYIGSWYKADTRKIMYLNVNLNNNEFYSLDLQFDKDVLSEWESMETVKEKTVTQLNELERTYSKAKSGFDKMYAEALVSHKQALEEALEEYEYLNTKMLKKQSDLDAMERQIQKERQIIEQIQKEPDIYFHDAESDIHELESAVLEWRRRKERLDLIGALVKREKNEIAEYLKDYKQFIKEINELAALFGTVQA